MSDNDEGSNPKTNDEEIPESVQDPLLDAENFGKSAEAEADSVAPSASLPVNNWDTGVSVAAHIAALQAKHEAELKAKAAELQAAVLAEQLKRVEVEKELAVAQSAGPSSQGGGANSEGSTSSIATGNSRAERRKRELAWDRLPYVPVGNYEGNPFRGPDSAVHLGNRDRPQPFRLEHDPTYKELQSSNNSMKFEYEIHAPLLWYFWGISKFLSTDFKAVVLGESTAEERAPYVEALENSVERSLEWFSVRHALITQRARALAAGEKNSPVLQHMQEDPGLPH